jgi:DNA invertase Pin-like site-specific DNA recombinase
MKGAIIMNVAYVRVSTAEQSETRQVEALEKHCIEKWFTEKVSGKDTNRPQLQAMLDYVREGDTVYVHDFSRLARSTKDLLTLMEKLKTKGVYIVSNKENIDSSTPTGKLMLTMIGAIAEFERQNMLERQREGIAIAKREGKFKGGQVKKVDDKIWSQCYSQFMQRELTKVAFAKALNISRPALDKLLKERRGE